MTRKFETSMAFSFYYFYFTMGEVEVIRVAQN